MDYGKGRIRRVFDSRKSERTSTVQMAKGESILKSIPNYMYGWGRSLRSGFHR